MLGLRWILLAIIDRVRGSFDRLRETRTVRGLNNGKNHRLKEAGIPCGRL